jgi:hypothetical protein
MSDHKLSRRHLSDSSEYFDREVARQEHGTVDVPIEHHLLDINKIARYGLPTVFFVAGCHSSGRSSGTLLEV